MKGTYTVDDYLMLMIVVSFMGFVLENVFCILWDGYIDNRNMNLPFLFGYGCAIMGFYLILGVPERENYLLYFCLAFGAVCAGEILLGKLVERICGFYWWDYTFLPLHITRYTSVPTSLGFASLITLFMAKGFFPMLNAVSLIPDSITGFIAKPLFVILFMDMWVSYFEMFKKRAHNDKWKIWVNQKKKEEYLHSKTSN